jgi:hypothetical protein
MKVLLAVAVSHTQSPLRAPLDGFAKWFIVPVVA